MNTPLVSIVCLCHNQAKWVAHAIHSAVHQNYPNIEIVVVDDASTDHSKKVIQQTLENYPSIKTIFNEEQKGNCYSFNQALHHINGKYVIDLAADDILLPNRVIAGVTKLESLPKQYGVHFTDAAFINPAGDIIGYHYERNFDGKLKVEVLEGDIYRHLVERYLICAPTMMMKREVLLHLGGYDESLTYEDFDFWIRSSRNYYYCYSDEVLVYKRVLVNSLSSQQKRRKNNQAMSTALICQKALKLNKNKMENQALAKRISYELRWALITENWNAAELLSQTLKETGYGSWKYFFYKALLILRLPYFKIHYFLRSKKS